MLTSLVLLLLGLVLGYIIGFFNKKVAARMRVISFFLKNLKLNWPNLRQLPRQLKSLGRVVRRKRHLFWRLFARNRQTSNN